MAFTCRLCDRSFAVITNTHLKAAHDTTIAAYSEQFGNNGVGILVNPCTLPKSDERFLLWKDSLKKRPPAWSKGFTKDTHLSVLKISHTFKEKQIDNFKKWREKTRFLRTPVEIIRSGDLAELIGVTLGDGHIEKFPRTECITIVGNNNNPGFISRYAFLVEKLFQKKPYVKACSDKNATLIRIYQKEISKRLGIPTGNRHDITYQAPRWIWTNRENLIRFLRGLYEAEGSFSVHKPTSTYKLQFANRNISLLRTVRDGLLKLGFHPHCDYKRVQLSRKAEVYACKDLLEFRRY